MTTFARKRIYEPANKDDGYRVLIDRVWPRGIKKSEAKLDDWQKDIAPSSELRKWFGHKPERFNEFSRRYKKELANSEALSAFKAQIAAKNHVSLLYGAKDTSHNQAVVLQQFLEQ